MKLTIEHLAAYLPYGINAEMMDFMNDYVGKQYDKIVGIHQWDKSGKLWCALTEGGSKPSLDRIKPLLRSLSDLTKEIEHNGERFVPIEWFEIGDDSNDSVEYDNGNIKLIRSLESLSKNGFANEVEYFPYGVITKLLSWHFDIYSLIPQGLAIPIKLIDNEKQD